MQRCHDFEERERQMRLAGRLEDADLARQQRESLPLPKARLALVIDQLEELFTGGFSPDVQLKYVCAIAGLVRSGRVIVLATLRSDFYPSYQRFPDLIELTKPGGKVDLRPPTAYEIGNIIRLPAEAAGINFERDPETVMGVITILAVVAGFQWFRADQQRRAAAQAFKSEAQVAAKLKEQLRQASLGELQPGRSSVPGGRVAGGHRSSCACDQVQPAKPGCFRTILPGINPASRKGATLAYRILNLPRFSRRCGVQSRWGSDIDCDLGQDCQALGCGHGQNHR
jgi:hypothetical protein